jgi:NAD(P)-dependent dehydrogenase (short-subunit alcohol dehydrogenase family)
MDNLFDLTGKTAIVTGGDNGLLGPIWVETLKEAGAIVGSYDLPRYDVTNEKECKDFAFFAHPIDILVNNSAVDNPPSSKATFFGNFKEILDVNIIGAVNMCKAVIPRMIDNGGGVIVNIGSIQGYGGADHRNYSAEFEKPFGYNASKWAMRGLSKSITTQYGRYGIRAVTPSFGPYDGGKLSQEFLDKFLNNVPLGRCISKESLQTTLLYAVCCPELTGVDWRVDAGLGSWA